LADCSVTRAQNIMIEFSRKKFIWNSPKAQLQLLMLNNIFKFSKMQY